MLLPLPEVKRFFRLLSSLMGHVDAAGRKGGKKGKPYDRLPTQSRFAIHQQFAQDPAGYVERYVLENPDRFEADDLAEIASWKDAVSGRLLFYRQFKKHLIVLETTANPRIFAVLGLSQPIEQLVGGILPAIGQCLLLPYCGAIVCDGVISSKQIRFGSGIRRMFEATYKEAKAARAIIETLGHPPKKQAKPRAKAGAALANLVSALRESLSGFRKERAELARFEDETIPAFEQWMVKHLGRQREELAVLNREIDELMDALDILVFNEFPTSCRSGEEAVEAAMRMARSVGPDEVDEADAENGEASAAGPPEELIEALFDVFMTETRGIDPSAMDEAEAAKAFDEFRESCRHAQEGNHSAFKRTLLGIGADRSEENLKAVAKAYRRVAKLLHPDKGTEHDEETKELWERLRLAKEALDLGMIVRVEMEWFLIEGHSFGKPDLPRLKTFQKQLKADFAGLKSLRRNLETHPMWGCEGRTPPKSLARSLKASIAEEIRILKFEKADLETRIDAFRRTERVGRTRQSIKKISRIRPPKKKRKAEPTASSGTDQMEFEF